MNPLLHRGKLLIVTVALACGGLDSTLFAAGQAPAVPRQQPAACRDSYGVQPLAYPGRVRPPICHVTGAAVIGRRWS
jgi:hypothetical protein